jgi:hypothetical protein
MSTDDPEAPTPDVAPVPTPAPPELPEVEQVAPEDLIADQPSAEEIIERAESPEKVIADQPSVDELLGRKPPSPDE